MRKEKKFFKNHGDKIFLRSPSWSICKHRIYKCYLANLISNWECWLVDTGRAALQVVCSCTCVCSLVLAHLLSDPSGPLNSLPLQQCLQLQSWSMLPGGELSPVSRNECREHQLILLGEVAAAWRTALLKLLWAARQAHQMSCAWLQINNCWCAEQDKILYLNHGTGVSACSCLRGQGSSSSFWKTGI